MLDTFKWTMFKDRVLEYADELIEKHPKRRLCVSVKQLKADNTSLLRVYYLRSYTDIADVVMGDDEMCIGVYIPDHDRPPESKTWLYFIATVFKNLYPEKFH